MIHLFVELYSFNTGPNWDHIPDMETWKMFFSVISL